MAPIVSLSKIFYPYISVLVGHRNGLEYTLTMSV